MTVTNFSDGFTLVVVIFRTGFIAALPWSLAVNWTQGAPLTLALNQGYLNFFRSRPKMWNWPWSCDLNCFPTTQINNKWCVIINVFSSLMTHLSHSQGPYWVPTQGLRNYFKSPGHSFVVADRHLLPCLLTVCCQGTWCRFQWGGLDRPVSSHHEELSDCVQCVTQAWLRECVPWEVCYCCD